MTTETTVIRTTAAYTLTGVEGVDVPSMDVTIVKSVAAGSASYVVFDSDVNGNSAKSISGAISKFCEGKNVVAKNYTIPGAKDLDFIDPNAPSDDWHDYEGADALGKEIKKLAAGRDKASATFRASNVSIARAFVKADALIASKAARSGWLDEFFPEGRNNSDASELRKLGNWPDELLNECPDNIRTPKGFDKWLLELRGRLAEYIVTKAASADGGVSVGTLDAAYLSVPSKLSEGDTDLSALYSLHAANIEAAQGFTSCVVQDEDGAFDVVRLAGMKVPQCRAIISNQQDSAADELLAMIVKKANNLPTAEDEAKAVEQDRTEKTTKIIRSAEFVDLDAQAAALHLFNIACQHPDLGDIGKVFSQFCDNVASGAQTVDAVLSLLSASETAEADEGEAEAAEDAA